MGKMKTVQISLEALATIHRHEMMQWSCSSSFVSHNVLQRQRAFSTRKPTGCGWRCICVSPGNCQALFTHGNASAKHSYLILTKIITARNTPVVDKNSQHSIFGVWWNLSPPSFLRLSTGFPTKSLDLKNRCSSL